MTRIDLPRDRETGKLRGFAYVEMSNEAEEDASVSELDGAEWLGREIKVRRGSRGSDSGGRRS